jgi:pyruvate carboxylase
MCTIRYVLDSEIFTIQVKVAEPQAGLVKSQETADRDNPYHVAAPSSGDLWIMYVHPGEIVKAGEELFNISIMKQEKAVLSPADGMVKRVLKYANYQEDKKMVPVKEGELLVELGPVPKKCEACEHPIVSDAYEYCPTCGEKL